MEGPLKQTTQWVPTPELQARMKRAEKYGVTQKSFDDKINAAMKRTKERWDAESRREKKSKARAQAAAAEKAQQEGIASSLTIPANATSNSDLNSDIRADTPFTTNAQLPAMTAVNPNMARFPVSHVDAPLQARPAASTTPNPYPAISVPKEPTRSASDSRVSSPHEVQPVKSTRSDPATSIPKDIAVAQDLLRRELSVPDWYLKIKPNGPMMKAVVKSKEARPVLRLFDAFEDTLQRCEGPNDPKTLHRLFDDLRKHVHKFEFLPQVNEHMLVKSHMLDIRLQRIIAPKGTIEYPWDLQEDTYQLFDRWSKKIFSVDLLRGIQVTKKKNEKGASLSLDEKWRTKYSKFPNYYGQGSLAVGQWWPLQICTLRDAAHGSSQGGIYGERTKGAYSVIVAGGGGYEDEDHGTDLWYCGTESKTREATESTQRMFESLNNKQPVRLIRSAGLPVTNPYRPYVGYRYDGLYTVEGMETMDEETAAHRFKLVRCPGQRPIRYGTGKPSSRPTNDEVEAYQNEIATLNYEMRAK